MVVTRLRVGLFAVALALAVGLASRPFAQTAAPPVGAAAAAPTSPLDFEVFKPQIQPILLARCEPSAFRSAAGRTT